MLCQKVKDVDFKGKLEMQREMQWNSDAVSIAEAQTAQLQSLVRA
jgi:hypothetical protein